MNGSEEINLLKSILFSFILIFAVFILLNTTAVIIINDAKIIFILPIIQLISFIIMPVRIMIKNKWSIKYNLKINNNFRFSILLAAIAAILGYFIFNFGFDSALSYILPNELYAKFNEMLISHNEYFDKFLFHSDFRIVAVAAFTIIIAAPVSEELLFRGFLQTPLENCLNSRSAIALSASLFALIHFNFAAFPLLFILGLILGYFAYYTQNIIYPIIIHIFNNAIAFIKMQLSYKEDYFLNHIELNPEGTFLFVFFGAFIIVYSIYYISQTSRQN